MKIISFITEKGGTGKTTGAREVAGVLSLVHNKKVLLIDCDFQQNLTESLIEADQEKNIFRAIKEKDLKGNIIPIERDGKHILDLIPASLNLKDLEYKKDSVDMEMIYLDLKKGLEQLQEYDYIIIDCRPDMRAIERAVLKCSNYVITPVEAHLFSFRGFELLENFIQALKKDLNTPFIHFGYINRLQNDKEILEATEDVRNSFDNILDTPIRDNLKIFKASQTGHFIIEYSSTSNGAKDFKTLTKELLNKWQ